ncbi:MAG: SurA N-terminal domain-containing protein [bacterium]|jgi:peptidyl-prolyl cis-trans isomerase D|nr:SurA N-terminal domain-containing protein [bacterium]
MFQFLRSRAKLFYWVIALSFLAFVYIGFGDAGCDRSGSAGANAGVIGTVNGTPITAQEYDQAVRQQVAMMRQQAPDRELNANQYATAQDRAWDSLVQNALVEAAIRERKIKISDQEVLDTLTKNPPAEVLAQYRDANGQIDMNRYYADLQNPDNDWTQIENYVRQVLLPRQKLSDEVAAGAVVSEEDVRREYARQAGLAMAEYIGVPFADITDGYNPTEQEISDWYAAHPDDYKHDGLATCKVVRFAKAASSADEKEVLDTLNEVRANIESGTIDFATAAKQYSDDTGSGARGGDLGTFDRNRMVPEFTTAAFALPVGKISEPVRTKFGFHLIEVTAQQTGAAGNVDQITARHILIKVVPGPQTLDLIAEAANGFRGRVDAASFASTAEAEAHELLTPAPAMRGRDIPGLALSLMGTNWLFTAKPGAVSPVFENDDCYFVVLAERIDPAGTRPLDEVRSQIMLALRKQHNTAVAKQRLAPAIAAANAGAALSVVARDHNLQYAVTDTFSFNSNVAEVGYGTDFNKNVLEGLVGRLTPEVETARGVYAAVPLWIKPIDEADFAARRAGIQQALLAQAQGEIVDKWMKEQREKAKIEDKRAEMRGNG